MEENNQNNQINTEEIKKEAINTANEVKESLKNTDIKKDANAAKGFVSNFIKNPIQEINNVVNSKNQFLKIAIIILAVWVVATLVAEIISIFQSYSYLYSSYTTVERFFKNAFSNIVSIVKSIIAPVLSLVVLSGATYFMAKDKKKPFINIATSLMIAKIPVVLASVVSLLGILGNQVYKITSPFSSFCSIISTVLVYFTIKALYSETDDNTFIKKFAIIMGIFYIAKFVINFLGIYI